MMKVTKFWIFNRKTYCVIFIAILTLEFSSWFCVFCIHNKTSKLPYFHIFCGIYIFCSTLLTGEGHHYSVQQLRNSWNEARRLWKYTFHAYFNGVSFIFLLLVRPLPLSSFFSLNLLFLPLIWPFLLLSSPLLQTFLISLVFLPFSFSYSSYYTVLQKKKVHAPEMRPIYCDRYGPIEEPYVRRLSREAGCRDIGAQSFHFLLFGYYFFMCDVLDEKV